jgi:signal transduction histidine kinase/DNA-binding response OmpR family regulator
MKKITLIITLFVISSWSQENLVSIDIVVVNSLQKEIKNLNKKAKNNIFSTVYSPKVGQRTIKSLLLAFKNYKQVGYLKETPENFVNYTTILAPKNRLNKKFISQVANYKISEEASSVEVNIANTKRTNSIDKSIIITLFIYTLLLLFIILFFRKKQKNLIEKLEYAKQKELTVVKNNFLENISHEVRTPITYLIGYLVLLNEHTLDPKKTKHYLNLTLRNSEKMMHSLNSFLLLLKPELRPLAANKVTSNKINFFLKEIFSFFNTDFRIKRISFYYKTNILDSLAIQYDFESFKIIISNLISNAIKYSNTNAAIHFTVNLTDSHLNISVRDTGFGIPDEEKEKIFTRFYQSKSNTNVSGFGIGLSLVEDLIKKLQGTISLESEINVGSIFYIALPLKVDNYALYLTTKNLDFEMLSLGNNEIGGVGKETSKQPKVLIVDDSIEMITYLQELFLGYLDCTCAFNGQEALSKLKENSFDLIISDVRIPLINGIQLKEALNKIDTYKDIPFIMIITTYQDKLKELKTKLGEYDYIEKPFTKNEILSRVQSTLERSIYKKEVFSTEGNATDFKGSENLLIDKIRASILANLTNTDFTSKMLANLCGYEQKQLNKILKTKLGLSIVNIILEVRLLKAYDAIVKSLYHTISEVMYASGINSRSYFNKKFQQRFGITPGDLRRKHRS